MIDPATPSLLSSWSAAADKNSPGYRQFISSLTNSVVIRPDFIRIA